MQPSVSHTFRGSRREVAETFRGIAIEVVQAIPKTWNWVSGDLCLLRGRDRPDVPFGATVELRGREIALVDTGMGKNGPPARTSVFPLLLKGEIPRNIHFNEAGKGGSQAFLEAIGAVTLCLNNGYTGWLQFALGDGRGGGGMNAAYAHECFITYRPGCLSVLARYKVAYGGALSNLEAVLRLCRTFPQLTEEVRS